MDNTKPRPASNSDVLRRFGRKGVMWRAHGIYKRRQWGVQNFSDALRMAWKSYRSQIDRERDMAARRAQNAKRYGSDSLLARIGTMGQRGRGSYDYMTTVMGA